ncbi:glutamate--tRNA ligase family protein [Flexibacterium corallicola]|uniref:glutamate--tRNA ligase family protein n=1 Tax=Flexibacterium corallicola TaxID=3037259 RepID=UPI00286F9D6C|nr:glutamate--tRNA ligase family protein [Pseudovibrio sp. M1P-2-3]
MAGIFGCLPYSFDLWTDGAKLSKRHGAIGAEAYRAMGYLPAAMRNYLARLGWSHGDDEIFSTDQMIEWFDLTQLANHLLVLISRNWKT